MNLAKLVRLNFFSSSAITVLYKNLYTHLPGFGAKIKVGAGEGVGVEGVWTAHRPVSSEFVQVGCGSCGSHCVCPDPSPAEVSACSFQWDQVSSQDWPRPARGDLEAGGVCAEHSTVRA